MLNDIVVKGNRQYKDITPTMTSNNAPSPYKVATTSANMQPYLAFDGKEDTYYRSQIDFKTGTVTILLETKHKITRYTLCNNYNISWSMKHWLLQGSNDGGTTWTTVDEQTMTAWVKGTIYEFEVANPNYYQKYRINCDSKIGDNSICISEMRLYENVKRNFEIRKIKQSNINSLTLSDFTDALLITEQGKLYATKNDKTLLELGNGSASGSNNIQFYTKLEQLNLASGCSTGDIFNAMPNNSYLEIGCNLSKTEVLYNVSDLPTDYGLLTIRKYDKTRFAIELKLSGGSVISPNEMWIGQLKGSDGTNVSWKRVCTTSIADTELTPISLDSTVFTSDTKAYYQVINGICHINFMTGNFLSTLTSAIVAKTIATGLPKANTSQTAHTFIPWAGVSAGQQVIFFIDHKGNLILHTTDNIANACVYTSFSYPVKES